MLRVPKNLIIGYLNINCVIINFLSTVLSKNWYISKFFAEGFKVHRKDRTKNEGGRLLYVNENLPGKFINSYKFKENSEYFLFELGVSNK